MKNILLFIAIITLLSACSGSDNKLRQSENTSSQDQITITNDLENAIGVMPSWYNESHVIIMNNPPAHSGNFACITNDTLQYSYTFKEVFKNINDRLPKMATFSGWAYTTIVNPKLTVVCNINDENGKQYNWKAVPLGNSLTEPGNWVEFKANFYFDKLLNPNQEIGFFVWNQGKETVYLDDLVIFFQY